MSESSFPPPPAYEEVNKTSKPQNSDRNWQVWYQKMIELKFNEEEADGYAKLLVNNAVEISMISELNDGVLKSIGIEKAGHRIRILRLQKKSTSQIPAQAPAVVQPAVNIPRCAWHPNTVANEKCRKCKRLVCLRCRREKPNDSGTQYYCQGCYDDCTIL